MRTFSTTGEYFDSKIVTKFLNKHLLTYISLYTHSSRPWSTILTMIDIKILIANNTIFMHKWKIFCKKTFLVCVLVFHHEKQEHKLKITWLIIVEKVMIVDYGQDD